jgi:hypothetical protein
MREEYIKMRNSGNYDINWFYKYFLSESNKQISLSEFYSIFTMHNLDDIITMMDYRFKINRLEDKDGRFIKVID